MVAIYRSLVTYRNKHKAVAYPECTRGGGVSHFLAEKRGVSFTSFQKMHENAIFSPIRGGGAYAGFTQCWIRHCKALTQCCFNVGSPSATLVQHKYSIVSTSRVYWHAGVVIHRFAPRITHKQAHLTNVVGMLVHHLQRWPNIKKTLGQLLGNGERRAHISKQNGWSSDNHDRLT